MSIVPATAEEVAEPTDIEVDEKDVPEGPSGPPPEWVAANYLEAFMRVRARLGLEADPETVRRLIDDGASVERGLRFGVPLTSEEFDRVEADVEHEEARASLLDRVYQADPASFGGSRDDGAGLVVLLSSAESPAALVAAKEGVTTQFTTRSIADFDATLEALDLEVGSGVLVHFDPWTDSVTVEVDSLNAESDGLVSRLSEVGFSSVSVLLSPGSLRETDEVGYGANTTDPGHPCRPAHCSPLVGGFWYNCTFGFGVEAVAGNWGRGWATAGHCADPGDPSPDSRWLRQTGAWNSSTWFGLGGDVILTGHTQRQQVVTSTTDIGWLNAAERLVTGTNFQEDAVHWRQITGIRNWWQLTTGGGSPSRLCASWGRQRDAPQCGNVTFAGTYRVNVDLDTQDLSVGGDSGSPYWIEGSPWLAVGVHSGDTSVGGADVYAGSVTALPALLDAAVITETDREAVFIISMYGRAFNRHPDVGGYAYWKARTCSQTNLRALVRAFYKNGEFEAKYDTDSFDSFNHVRTLVRLLYRGALGREPDSGGLQFWTNYVWTAGGNAARETAWNQAVDAFAASSEFSSRYFSGALGEGGLGLCAT